MPNWDLGLRGGSKAHPEQKERGASSEGPAECQGNQGNRNGSIGMTSGRSLITSTSVELSTFGFSAM